MLRTSIHTLPKTGLLLLIFISGFIPSAYAARQDQYAMVFFFRSDCPYCHQFAPTLRQFTEQNNLMTYAFSLDNQPLPQYPVPIPATPDISQTFFENPRDITVPATFLINVNSRKFVKISIGNVTYTELASSVNGVLNDPEILRLME